MKTKKGKEEKKWESNVFEAQVDKLWYNVWDVSWEQLGRRKAQIS